MSDKADPERDAVAAAWGSCGGTILRIGRFWQPPELDPSTVRLYGSDTFCLVLAEKLGLRLVSPADDLIRHVPQAFLRREVSITSLDQVLAGSFPAFVKPLMPKQFGAQVYRARNELEFETRGLRPETAIIRSSVVGLQAECRAFILEGRVVASAVYEGAAPVPGSFLMEMIPQLPLPSTCVIDCGLISDGGWAFLEANAAWGAGLNGCEASLVLPCIEGACRPAA